MQLLFILTCLVISLQWKNKCVKSYECVDCRYETPHTSLMNSVSATTSFKFKDAEAKPRIAYNGISLAALTMFLWHSRFHLGKYCIFNLRFQEWLSLFLLLLITMQILIAYEKIITKNYAINSNYDLLLVSTVSLLSNK